MKIIVTIEARMGSTRLPGKVLMQVCNKPLLQHMIERLKRAILPDDIVVATTVNPKDDQIIKLCKKIKCSYYRGSEEDITDRLIKTAHYFNANIIVQTTGDCPLHEATVIDKAIKFYLKSNKDYISNRLDRTYPAGLDTQVYNVNILERVAKKTNDPNDLEHGSLYIYTHPKEFTIDNFKSEDINCPEKRWCLDYQEDYDFFKVIYEKLYPKNPQFNIYDVLELLKKEPELENINKMYPCDIKKYEY